VETNSLVIALSQIPRIVDCYGIRREISELVVSDQIPELEPVLYYRIQIEYTSWIEVGNICRETLELLLLREFTTKRILRASLFAL